MWCYDVDTAEDANLTEGDIHLMRTPISTPPSAQVSRRSRSAPGTLALLVGGAGGGKGGWEGTSNSLIVIYKKMADVLVRP